MFQTALECAPDDRSAFISAACGDDDFLRREVEALLAADEEAGSLIETPAYAVAAPLIAGGDAPTLMGKSIGHYQIISPLGKGGMGEVYTAKDTRLGRKVALKLLPVEFTTDADRLRRFEREARAASALNHPNILTIYDIGEDSGQHFIAAELVEGVTVRQQLEGKRPTLAEALKIAIQIAAALEAAHGAGIVHRDIKPENVMVRPDGLVKVLDFGLAKLAAPSALANSSEAPTLARSSTAAGVVLGTLRYMSPEQARGEKVDARTDIFSLGVMLYELVAGHTPFEGVTPSETIAAILRDEPSKLSGMNLKISPQLRRILLRCLEKRPEERFQSASDLGFALEALLSPESLVVQSIPNGRMHTLLSGWRERIWVLTAGTLSLALFALGLSYFNRPALKVEMARLFVTPPEKATRFDYPTISPDGSTLAFVATVEGNSQIWVRPLSSTTTKPLVDVGTVDLPFWSPDSRFIAYFEDRKLKKIAATGGQPDTLCDVPSHGGGAWNREGIILFSTQAGGIKRIPANGGTVTTVTTVDRLRGETTHSTPVFLPDGRHFLFHKANIDPTKNGIYLASFDEGETKLLLPSASPNVGVGTGPVAQNEGYLVFMRQGSLQAQSFDFSRNQLVGESIRLAEHIGSLNGGIARFSLSTSGVLVLIEDNGNQQLTWFDRSGKKLSSIASAGIYALPDLSPDEQRLAVGQRDPQTQTYDIRLFDLRRGTDSRFTFDPAGDNFPRWSPDSSRIVWDSNREGASNLYQKAANGVGEDEILLKSTYSKQARDWSADGRFILYRELNSQTQWDLWVLPMEGERKPWPWLNTQFSESSARFSPDGKWVAYTSNASGRYEIYIQAFVPGASAAGGKWQISTNGGYTPAWRRDGRELYYISADSKLMAVDVTLSADVKAGKPKELFSLNGIQAVTTIGYTTTGDGQRFLFVTSMEETRLPPFTVVLNWIETLKR